MPAEYHAFPPAAYDVKIVRKGHDYPIDIDAHGFTRTGVDGAEKILALFTNEQFKSEYLEPLWKKGWDADISVFTAIVDTTNDHLELSGKAAVAGDGGAGWINSNQIIPLLNGMQVTVAMESPIADTGVTADRDIRYEFYLRSEKEENSPRTDDEFLRWYFDVDESGLICYITTNIAGASTIIFSGSTYDDASARDPAAAVVWIWRIIFHDGHAGEAAPSDDRHMHVYLKQGANLAAAEAASESQLSSSPYDISGLLFEWGYPALRIRTEDDTNYFGAYGSGNEAVCAYIRTAYVSDTTKNYPPFTWKFKPSPADADGAYLLGACEIWDGDPDSGGVQVHDEDHVFANDPYLQNGLIRCEIERATSLGLDLYVWTGAAWLQITNEVRFDIPATVTFPFLTRIISVTSEATTVRVRLQDSADDDNDNYVDLDITIKRGRYFMELQMVGVFPLEEARFRPRFDDRRFCYIGDDAIRDDELGSGTVDNTTMTDNFALQFDEDGDAYIGVFMTADHPDGTIERFAATTTQRIFAEDYTATQMNSALFYLGVAPFTLIANLFEEAEDATISAAVRSNLDGDGVDTVTENDGVWAATLNCAVDENNLVENSVGVACVDINSSGAGAVQATCTPTAPLGKLTKFDDLKVYLHGNPNGSSVTIRLIDADGDSVTKAQAITGAATEYTIPLPHSDSDLQGWTEVGTFVYTTFTTWRIEWAAAGAGEHVYVDGARNYIGTTTTRGRGETLSGGDAVVLDAQNEYVEYVPDGGTDLPEGYYLAVVRAKDTDQVASDLEQHVYDEDDSEYRNEDNQDVHHTLASSFGHKLVLFHISAEDVSDTDAIRIRVKKDTATENTIFVDYFLIIPLGDGENGPMDLAHSALRKYNRPRRLKAI